MKKYIFILLGLLSIAAAPARQATYTSGEVISSSEVTSNEDAIFNYLQAGVDTYSDLSIVNADVATEANIQSSKLNLQSISQNVLINSSGSFENDGTSKFDGNITSIANIVTGAVTFLDLNGGLIDNIPIGRSTATTGKFTSLEASTFYLGTRNQGDILYDNGTSLVRLTPGTNGQYLETNGSSANPSWSNVTGFSNLIYHYQGQVSQVGASEGETNNSSLNPDGATGTYRFIQTAQTSLTTILTGKWTKISGVNSITAHALMWSRNSGGSANPILLTNVGGQTQTITGSEAVTTPTWYASSAIDVSGLTNGTVYDITIQLRSDSGDEVFLGSLLLLGS